MPRTIGWDGTNVSSNLLMRVSYDKKCRRAFCRIYVGNIMIAPYFETRLLNFKISDSFINQFHFLCQLRRNCSLDCEM